tara:strand:- start:1195 stop:1497 length:303 start_codon:yes stop_codon:yes gene_type:complete
MNRQTETATDDNAKTFRAVAVFTAFIYCPEHELVHFRAKNGKPLGLTPLSAFSAMVYPSFEGVYISEKAGYIVVKTTALNTMKTLSTVVQKAQKKQVITC